MIDSDFGQADYLFRIVHFDVSLFHKFGCLQLTVNNCGK